MYIRFPAAVSNVCKEEIACICVFLLLFLTYAKKKLHVRMFQHYWFFCFWVIFCALFCFGLFCFGLVCLEVFFVCEGELACMHISVQLVFAYAKEKLYVHNCLHCCF